MEIEEKLIVLGKVNFKRDKSLPVILMNSDPWKAWLAWRVSHKMKTTWWKRQEKVTVPTLYPPIDLDALISGAGAGSLSERLK